MSETALLWVLAIEGLFWLSALAVTVGAAILIGLGIAVLRFALREGRTTERSKS